MGPVASYCCYAQDEGDVVGVAVCFRHGARAPNKEELAAFGPTNPVRTQWHASDGEPLYQSDDNLTDAGRAQMAALGAHFGDRFGAQAEASISWESSPAPRCAESGEVCLRGLRTTCPEAAAAPAAPAEDGARAATFKAWDARGTAYKKLVDGLKRGGDASYNAAARARRPELQAVYERLGESHVAAGDAQLLYWSCYAHCLAEAEAYDGTRKALTDGAGPEALARFEEDARETWGLRFLRTGGHAGFIGGLLRQKLLRRRAGLALYSGHDYSILALLAACGVEDYDFPALGYGAYVLVEHLAGGGRRVSLNPAPFRDASGAVCQRVDESRVITLHPDDGLSLGLAPECDADLVPLEGEAASRQQMSSNSSGLALALMDKVSSVASLVSRTSKESIASLRSATSMGSLKGASSSPKNLSALGNPEAKGV